MLSIFRTNQLVASILLLAYVAVLWIPHWIMPGVEWKPTGQGIFTHKIYQYIGYEGFVPSITAMILIWVQGFMINALAARFRIEQNVSQLPGLFYIFISSCLADFFHLSPALMGNTFLILALFSLFETFRKSGSADHIFNTGFWMGIGFMFHFGMLALLPAMLIGLNLLRSFRLNEYLILLIGFGVACFLAGTWYYWHGTLPQSISLQWWDNIGISHLQGSLNDWQVWVKIGFFALLLVFAIFNYEAYSYKQNMSVQKYMSIMYWLLVFSSVSLLFQGQVTLDIFLLMAVSLGFFMAFTFGSMVGIVAELCHLMLLLAILLFQLVKL